MDDSLYFSEQHLATREMVRQFARDEVAPVAAKHDADATFPWDNIRKMGELGLLGVPWPEELGGAGLDLISYMIVIHELAKVDASHGLTISAHTTLGTSPIVRFGTDEQKRRYVPFLATGKVMGGFGLTEPDAGSDAGGTRIDGGAKGRLLRAQRREAIHHPRRRRRDLRRHGRDRSDRRARRASARSSSPSRPTIPRARRQPASDTSRHLPRCPASAPARRRTSSDGARRTPAS